MMECQKALNRLTLAILATAALGGIAFFSTVTGSICGMGPPSSWTVLPEYERSLQHVVLSIESRGGHLDAYEGLLIRLPSRTRVSILVPERHLDRVRARFRSLSPACRMEWIPFEENPLKKSAHAYLLFPEKRKLIDTGPLEDIHRFQGSAWAQDLFESAVDREGRPVLLIPEVHKWFVCPDGNAPYQVISDNRFLEALEGKGFLLQKTPLTFRGGNILVDRMEGKLVAFCGGDVFRLTRTVWRAMRDGELSPDETEDTLKRLLGVDELVVLRAERSQPEYLFHLDQAMAFLGNGRVAVTRIVQQGEGRHGQASAISEVRDFLSELRGVLRSRGYRIVDLETPAKDLLAHRYAVNGIPYTDPESGQRTFLMPVYDALDSPHPSPFLERNRTALERSGYRVLLVPTTADKNYGGIHCLAHVIR